MLLDKRIAELGEKHGLARSFAIFGENCGGDKTGLVEATGVGASHRPGHGLGANLDELLVSRRDERGVKRLVGCGRRDV